MASEPTGQQKHTEHVVVDIPDETPPVFTPYEAEFFESDDGDIISHDHHLNEDGTTFWFFFFNPCLIFPAFR